MMKRIVLKFRNIKITRPYDDWLEDFCKHLARQPAPCQDDAHTLYVNFGIYWPTFKGRAVPFSSFDIKG